MRSHQLARMLLDNADCVVTYQDEEDLVEVAMIYFTPRSVELTWSTGEFCYSPQTQEEYKAEEEKLKNRRAIWL
jgi:hypothetical protein